MAHDIMPAVSHRGRTIAGALALGFVLVAPTVIGGAVALADVPCSAVFSGATPQNPIVKTADKTTAVPGEEVTYTIEWDSTGAPTTDITDCFRVDEGADTTLNALVTPLNIAADVPNVGPNGSAQSYSHTVTIPDDASLIGHDVVNRVGSTHGSVESRSALVSVSIVAPEPDPDPEPTEEPTEEICDDGIDNDSDGQIDEGCSQPDPEPEPEPEPEPDPQDDTTVSDDVIDPPAAQEEETDPAPVRVAGEEFTRSRALAKTGATTTIAWFGAVLLFAGLGMRHIRFRSPKTAFAGLGVGPGTVAQSVLLSAAGIATDGTKRWALHRRVKRRRDPRRRT